MTTFKNINYMTAIIGILNKRAAVIAADSAKTVVCGDKMKIFNNTTKIFDLTQHGSIGVMVFGSANFMRTPWEVIINLYHARRGARTFDSVKEYAEDFFDFLRSSDFFISKEEQMNNFIREFELYYSKVKDDAEEGILHLQKKLPSQGRVVSESIVNSFIDDSRNHVGTLTKCTGITPDFKDYTEEDFKVYLKKVFEFIRESSTEEYWPYGFEDDWQKRKWQHGFYNYLRSRLYFYKTGLVFVGYGEKDIFPTLLPIYVSMGFENKLRGYIDDSNKSYVHDDDSAFVCPFAQTDVMSTLIRGIAPDFQNQMNEAYQLAMMGLKEKIAKLLKKKNVLDEIVDEVMKVSTTDIDKKRHDTLQAYMETYGNSIIDSIDSFSIEDMANMAESFISITGLQRHFSSSDETVGGPIDVAVITKADGFKWLKCKNA